MSRAKKVRRGFGPHDGEPGRTGRRTQVLVEVRKPPYDHSGHPLFVGDIVRVRVRGNPRAVIASFYRDITNGVQLATPVRGFVSWNGDDLVRISSPQRLAEVLTA